MREHAFRFQASVLQRLVTYKLLLETLRRKMTEDGRKVLLRNPIAALAERYIRFLGDVPCRPVRKAGTVRVSGLGEIRPITLHQIRQLVIRRVKRQLAECARVKSAENVRKFEGMKCSQSGFALSRH